MTTARRFQRIYPYLAPQLRERLTKHCAANQTTESAVVREALDQYFGGTGDFALVLRRLDRISRGIERAHRDLEILSQAFAMFVRLWFAHTPRLPREARPAAQSSAEARYRQFLDRVAERIASGKRFVDDLPQERIADDDELTAIAEASGGKTPTASG
jgi:predicted DNA-binding protein